jgi:hypothetical protein
MERELWPLLYRAICEVGRTFEQKDVTYQPWILAAVLLWAALHDRPPEWACDEANWKTTSYRPLFLPSSSVISRRGHGLVLGCFWRLVEVKFRELKPPGVLSFVDGKPLVIGSYSKDPDTRKRGHAGQTFARGYRLHTLWSNRPMPEAWDLTTISACESKIAMQLVAQAARGGYLDADGSYDSSPLFDAAAQYGYQMLVPAPSPGAGRGKRYQSPYRLRSIELVRRSFGQELYRERGSIERLFGNATSFGGGLGPLPHWVRRRHRVRTWVWAKLLINAARICRKQTTYG